MEGPVIVVTKDVRSTVVRISPIPVRVALVVCSGVCLYINGKNEKKKPESLFYLIDKGQGRCVFNPKL